MEYLLDQSLNAQVKLDVGSDVVRIDVLGAVSRDTRPALLQLIQRIRRSGFSCHIRVDLSRSPFVESTALAGLRHDLNAIDNSSRQLDLAGAPPVAAGVSLELQPSADDLGRLYQAVDLSADLAASVNPAHTRPLARYSYAELLAASDSAFSKLDDPAPGAASELLAHYEDLSFEIFRREFGQEAEAV